RRPTRSVAFENQFLSQIKSVVRKLKYVFRNLQEWIVEEPFDERVQLPVLFQDVENVMVPSVFPDQSQPLGRRGRRFADWNSLVDQLADFQLVALGKNSLPIGDNVIYDQAVVQTSQLGAKTAALWQRPQSVRSFLQIEDSVAGAVPSGQSTG